MLWLGSALGCSPGTMDGYPASNLLKPDLESDWWISEWPHTHSMPFTSLSWWSLCIWTHWVARLVDQQVPDMWLFLLLSGWGYTSRKLWLSLHWFWASNLTPQASTAGTLPTELSLLEHTISKSTFSDVLQRHDLISHQKWTHFHYCHEFYILPTHMRYTFL